MLAPVFAISSSSASLFIPHEILGEILSHCDACTLAVVSRVSSACLELASPFLYTDIVVKNFKSIINLFRLSPSFGAAYPKLGRVTPHTSLSLIHSITVHLGEIAPDFNPLNDLFLSHPLALPVFVVSMPGSTPFDPSRYYDPSALAHLVHPRTLIVYGRKAKLNFRSRVVGLALNNPTAGSWPRLEVVLLSGTSSPPTGLHRLRALPLRVIVDLVGATEKDLVRSELVGTFLDQDAFHSKNPQYGYHWERLGRVGGDSEGARGEDEGKGSPLRRAAERHARGSSGDLRSHSSLQGGPRFGRKEGDGLGRPG